MANQPIINQEGTNDVTDQVWVKLACNVTIAIGGGAGVVHIGVVFKATHPDSVDPGQVFDLTNSSAVQVLPPAFQANANAFWAPDAIGVAMTDFEVKGTGVSSSFASSTFKTFTDGATTNTSTTITSPALAQFNQFDVRRIITGTNIPANTVITAVASATSASISNAATATGSGITMTETTLGSSGTNGSQVNEVQALQPTNSDTPNPVDPLINPNTANPAPGPWWTDNSVAASDAQRHNEFTFGPIPMPGGTDVTYTHNADGPFPGTGGSPYIRDGRSFADGSTSNGSSTITSPAGAQFTGVGSTVANPAGDVGRSITGPGIPANTTITAVASATSATISNAATATANPVSLTLGGTSDPLHVFPLTANGAAGSNISIVPGQPGSTILMQDGTNTSETYAVHEQFFFHQTNTPPAKYTVALPVDCGLDTYAESGGGCPSQCSIIVPSPGYCTRRPSAAEPQGSPPGCFTSDDSTFAPASARPGISIPIVTPAPRVETAQDGNFFSLASSDGTTWQEMVNPDCATLFTDPRCPRVQVSPTVNQSVALRANADLFTDTTGYNQDIGIFVSDDGGADTLLAWKESGGSAGIFSPNAAYVQALYPMTGGHTYVFKLKWKTNQNAPGVTIYAGAGGGTTFPTRSHTSLTAETFPATNTPIMANKANFSSLANSDGTTWQPMDATLSTGTLSPASNSTELLGANADLFTDTTGYNQDIGIFVSVDGAAPTVVAWKESGGSAGIFSPNAAYVKEIYPMLGGHTYNFSVYWKTNKPANGVTIYAGAGSGSGLPGRSPTSLLAETLAAGANPYSAVKTNFSSLANSDGATWQPMDAALNVTVPGSDNIYAHLGANADLFTDTTGYNQDIGLFVSDNGGADTLVAWKESGGSAGIFSPNAAYVQSTYPLASGHTYVFKLKWKTNKNAPGVTIYAGAGGGGTFPGRSETTVVAQVTN